MGQMKELLIDAEDIIERYNLDVLSTEGAGQNQWVVERHTGNEDFYGPLFDTQTELYVWIREQTWEE